MIGRLFLLTASECETTPDRLFIIMMSSLGYFHFSTLFGAGVTSLFTVLTVALAIYILTAVSVPRVHWRSLPLAIRMGIVLFIWLTTSIAWSEAPLEVSLKYLMEYRIYWIAPLLFLVLRRYTYAPLLILAFCILGMFSALISSYMLYLNMIHVDGLHFSFANRIFHAFVLNLQIVLTVSIFVACFRKNLIFTALLGIVLLLTIYNLLNVETGRTGYVTFFALLFLPLLYFSSNFSRCILSVLGFILLFIFAYSFLEKFSIGVDQLARNVALFDLGSSPTNSVSKRMTFYFSGFLIFKEHPILGVGVGDVDNALAGLYHDGSVALQTDNVHSEFLNMLVSGGVIAGLLYLSIPLALALEGLKLKSAPMVICFVGLGTVMFVSGLFTSIIKDFGEKPALMVLIPVFYRLAESGVMNLFHRDDQFT